MFTFKKIKKYWYFWLPLSIFLFYELYKNFKNNITVSQNIDRIMNKGDINNPLNIRTSSINWAGKVTNTGDTFESFDTIDNGILAAYHNLQTYINVHGCNTITEIVQRWAPSNENNTSGYIDFVSNDSGFDANQILTNEDLAQLIVSMSKFEATNVVDINQVNEALNV